LVGGSLAEWDPTPVPVVALPVVLPEPIEVPPVPPLIPAELPAEPAPAAPPPAEPPPLPPPLPPPPLCASAKLEVRARTDASAIVVTFIRFPFIG
jgi:hypothetical protein